MAHSIGQFQLQARLSNGVHVRGAPDQCYLMASARQHAAVKAAHGACAHDSDVLKAGCTQGCP